MKEVIMKVPSFSADYPKAPIYVADLVRCKECKYGIYTEHNMCYMCNKRGFLMYNDAEFFCSYGERSEE